MAMKTERKLLEHIEILASDEFEGRMPGSNGEEKTVEYLSRCLKEIGAEPTNSDGSYSHNLSVTGIESEPDLIFSNNQNRFKPEFPSQLVAQSKHHQKIVSLDASQLVFVGYGIEAPEYGWNDYEGVDVKGKTVVILIGQPEKADLNNPDRLDDKFFKGRALTYYGRWTYKFEMAALRGAALIVHDTKKAGYGYDVVTASWTGENFQLDCPDNRVLIEGWLSYEAASELFQKAGEDFDKLKTNANKTGFKATALDMSLSARVENKIRNFESKNVIAKLEGNDPDLKNECIIYSAHWDHFGTKEKNGKVDVYSGAIDNGVAVAMTLEMARRFARQKNTLKRSVLFFFTTLEESGLLGAEQYVKQPLFPLNKTVAIINMDVMNVWGRTKDIVSIALGHSELDTILEKYAKKQNRIVTPDPEPEKGYFFRSDHMPFIRNGVPALFFLFPGSDYIDKPEGYGMKMRVDYLKNDYHKPTDKVKKDWDLSGTVEDLELLFNVGKELSSNEQYPQWNETSEFASASKMKIG